MGHSIAQNKNLLKPCSVQTNENKRKRRLGFPGATWSGPPGVASTLGPVLFWVNQSRKLDHVMSSQGPWELAALESQGKRDSDTSSIVICLCILKIISYPRFLNLGKLWTVMRSTSLSIFNLQLTACCFFTFESVQLCHYLTLRVIT